MFILAGRWGMRSRTMALKKIQAYFHAWIVSEILLVPVFQFSVCVRLLSLVGFVLYAWHVQYRLCFCVRTSCKSGLPIARLLLPFRQIGFLIKCEGNTRFNGVSLLLLFLLLPVCCYILLLYHITLRTQSSLWCFATVLRLYDEVSYDTFLSTSAVVGKCMYVSHDGT